MEKILTFYKQKKTERINLYFSSQKNLLKNEETQFENFHYILKMEKYINNGTGKP